ncbi:4Fe-4S binding protein [Roseobacter sp. HKCCA0434]|uniref:4Fe-4S binding protein n=1 Tax=Roseobacter sp. HKCCA0434 TaxID=3079297 RepID=UPI002905AAE8|nr:4Fe-4S binding protein [Roseobacter sp. HKCCA0434]
MWRLAIILGAVFWATVCGAQTLPRDEIAPRIAPPMELGAALNDEGVWELLNSGDAHAGYVFETLPMAPLPGFSGAPVNVLVVLDLDGRFIDVQLISHNEPIFVSGLGPAPFHAFFEQYRGHSISDTLVVGTPYGAGADGSALVYLDGVTKATASIRIAHESVMAAALKVARERMEGLASGPPAHPIPDHDESLDWQALLDQGIARRLVVTNGEVDAAFAGTRWSRADPEATARPDAPFLDLWALDIGPPAIARAVLAEQTLAELEILSRLSPHDEPVLLIETGRHGLVTEDFVRNTSPDLISAEQAGFPIALRDADLTVRLADGVPDALRDGTAMILRTDRRLGFDPGADWLLRIKALRERGMFQPEIGSVELELAMATPDRFFARPVVPRPVPPWLGALRERAGDMVVLAVGLATLLWALGPRLNRLADHRHYTPIRLGILAAIIGFVGWWGQGQLSIATPLAVLRTALEGGSFAFLLYDPFSLLLWVATIAGFVLWGRGLFCGWLCPFGAIQEFAHHLGRALRLPVWEPSPAWDRRLKWLKYGVLASLVGILVTVPAQLDAAIEVEPFKTAITTFFVREWYYVAYAVGLLILSMVLFKGFCRYLCPLGAVMALGGLIRGRDWIERRAECGSPCQLCRVKCNYGAIRRDGSIHYDECFACLDCVSIHDDPDRCVPLVLARKGRRLAA